MTTEKKRILIIDDEPIVCERLKLPLEKIGFSVETFTESARALERLAQQRFDVVVTDIKMSGADGMDLLRFVRQNDPAAKVIIITGFATAETAKEAIKGGAVDFIAKPFRISQLKDLVVSLTGEAKT